MVSLRRKKDALQKEKEQLEVKLATLDPLTQGAEYNQLLDIRAKLDEQSKEGLLKRIDPNTIVKLIGTFGLAGLIMAFESKGFIFGGKASSLLPKIL